MSRFAYWLILLPLFLIVIVFAVNNSGTIDISLWPVLDEKVVMPAHSLALIGLFIGFVFGGFVAWMQGGGTRSRLRQLARQNHAAEREVETLRSRLAALESTAAPGLPARTAGN